MRAIDADLLYDRVEARYRQSSGEEHRTEKSLLDAICISPTIDAIPVAWLCDYSGNHYDATGREATVLEALRDWKKENE